MELVAGAGGLCCALALLIRVAHLLTKIIYKRKNNSERETKVMKKASVFDKKIIFVTF